MTTPNPSIPAPVAERTKHPFLTYEMIYDIPEAIDRTLVATGRRLEEIETFLKEKTKLYFAGCGTAYFSSMLGADLLSLVERDCFDFECVPALELATRNSFGKNAATFAVSHSGITKTTLDALRNAKTNGSYTVGITHFQDSPITKVADTTLVVGNGPDRSRCHTKCYLSGATALAATALELLEQQEPTDAARLRRIRSELMELPQLCKKVLAFTDNAIKDITKKNAGKRTIYFAGTGGSYSNALEAALKVMETSYVPAQGFETEQLLHGPWVSLDDQTVLFVLATESATRERSMDLVRAATRLGAYVIPIVSESDREMSDLCKGTLELPRVDERLAPYLSIIPLYFFAYYMALERGHNPDYLRYLSPIYWDARTIIFPPGTH
jgi:glucosamine--fructose-6-phosphate aminotransferase (isomerizing)